MNKKLYFFSFIVLPLALSSCSYQPSTINNAQPTTEVINSNQNIDQNDNTDTANVNIQTNTNIAVPTNTNTIKSTTVNVTLSGFAFSPKTITIKKGTTVIWTNQDSVGHTVTSDSDSALNFSSTILNNSNNYKMTFNSVGTFSYHCSPHPNMTAKIIVTE